VGGLLNPQPKPHRETNKKYLAYIKTLPCACRDNTCVGDIVPHHTKTKGSGGSDYMTIPLCHTHHQRIHTEGKISLQIYDGMVIGDEILKNLIGYIKRLEEA
jgi:hypothetical protein